MINLYAEIPSIQQVFLNIIDIAIAISEADFGNIQLIDLKTNTLKIVAQRGLPQYWLDYWENVSEDKGSWRRSLECGKRIIVEEISNSPLFKGEDLKIQLRAGIRTVQSTPLMTRSGKMIGMFSTHYKSKNKLNKQACRLLDLLAKQAIDAIDLIKLQAQINEHKTELKREVALREECISVAGHELRTPLTSLKIATQLGKRLMVEEKLTTGKLIKLFDIWLGQLETFEYLISNMLDTSGTDSKNQFKFNCKKVDLNKIITKSIKKFANQVSYRGTSIIGYWDPYRIEQIVTNLVSNGIKYGAGKPVEIELYAIDGNNFKLIVRDYGIGIAL